MGKPRNVASKKYHESDNDSSGDDEVEKTPKSKPGPKSSKRNSKRKSNGSIESPRKSRRSNVTKPSTAESSEEETSLHQIDLDSESDGDNDTSKNSKNTPKAKPGPKSTKRVTIQHTPSTSKRGRPRSRRSDQNGETKNGNDSSGEDEVVAKVTVRGRGRPPRKSAETRNDDENEIESVNDSSGEDEVVAKVTVRGRGRPPRKSAETRNDDENENESVNDSSGDEQSSSQKETPKKSPNKVTKRKADSSTAEQSRPSSSKKPEKKNEDRYEVEEILDHKIEDGKKYFLIRWKGYGSDVDSWERHNNISCPALLAKYYEKNPDARLPVKRRNKRKKTVLLPMRPLKIDQQVDYDSDEWDKDEDYEVERILDVRFLRDNKREFLIRWKGYSSNSDTWEPEEHLNCEDLISKFMEKLERMKNVTTKDLRPVRSQTQRFTLMTQSDARRLSKRNRDRQRAVYYDCDE